MSFSCSLSPCFSHRKPLRYRILSRPLCAFTAASSTRRPLPCRGLLARAAHAHERPVALRLRREEDRPAGQRRVDLAEPRLHPLPQRLRLRAVRVERGLRSNGDTTHENRAHPLQVILKRLVKAPPPLCIDFPLFSADDFAQCLPVIPETTIVWKQIRNSFNNPNLITNSWCKSLFV